MEKENKIQEAWGQYYEKVKKYIDKDGFLEPVDIEFLSMHNGLEIPESFQFEEKEHYEIDSDCEILLIRPLELKDLK